MAGKFTCPEKDCDWNIELSYADGDGIRAILDHEKEHKKNTVEIEKTEREDCKHCDGKGYIEYTYTVDQDVSETDQG